MTGCRVQYSREEWTGDIPEPTAAEVLASRPRTSGPSGGNPEGVRKAKVRMETNPVGGQSASPGPGGNPDSLYGLMERTRALLDAIEEKEGEITPEQSAELDNIAMGLALKAEAYKAVCVELEEEAKACDRMAAPYFKRAASKRARAGLLKARLQTALEQAGIDRAVGPTGGASMRNSGAAVVLTVPTEDDVPEAYCERKRYVSKQRIADAIRAGTQISFAKLVTGRYLQWVK